MTESGVVVIVAPGMDVLATGMAERLRAGGLEVVVREPREIGHEAIVLDSTHLELQGCRVAAIVWRAPLGARLSSAYVAEDQSFADSEAGAAWLAALQLPGVFAVNRYSATVWYGGGQWPAWQEWLRQRGVPVSTLHLGEEVGPGHRWRPFLSRDFLPAPQRLAGKAMSVATSTARTAASALVVAGAIVGPTPCAGAWAAAAALTAEGIALARIGLDEKDRVLYVDATPDPADDAEREEVADRLAEAIHERVHSR